MPPRKSNSSNKLYLIATVLVFATHAIGQNSEHGGLSVKPDPNYKVSRTPDGQPDITGRWQRKVTRASPDESISALMGNGARSERKIIDPPDGKIPTLPLASDLSKQVAGRYIDPHATCVPMGLPRQTNGKSAILMIQTPGEVLFITTNLSNFRHIPVDGRPPIGKDMKLWMGSERGRWVGNTLVIEITNLNDKSWGVGPVVHSDQMRATERFGLIAQGTMQYEVTVEDPLVFAKPWTQGFPLSFRGQNFQMFETNCNEGNKSVEGQIWAGREVYPGFSSLKK